MTTKNPPKPTDNLSPADLLILTVVGKKAVHKTKRQALLNKNKTAKLQILG